MRSRRLPICLFVFLLLASGARAADWIVGGVPLPDDAAVHAPSTELSADQRRFLGVWTGSWDGLFHHILLVEQVHADGTASVVYAIAEYKPFNIARAWTRAIGTLAGDTLTLPGAATVRYTFESGTLRADHRHGLISSAARMKPSTLAAARDNPGGLDWSEPTSVFVDGPNENGAPSKLEVVLFRPPGAGPFRLAVLNHGSTGNGREPALFSITTWSYGLADYLTSKNWLVAFPQRRGRGRSTGLYDEGFEADRSRGYSCEPAVSLKGADRALTDIDAAVTALRARPDVARGPILMGGISRGGILSIAYAGRHPDVVSGVINFVGGWMGTGCGTVREINGTLFREGGRYPRPSLWLYGDGDRFYSIAHSRWNFDQFRAAGGTGTFLEFNDPDNVGHAVASFRDLWYGPVESYLRAVVDTARP